jgi:hypothetical protein
MDASFTTEGSRIFFHFKKEQEDDERIESLRFDMNEISPFVDMKEVVDPKEIHNDLIALSIILMINPFVGSTLKLNFPISMKFKNEVSSVISRYKIYSPEGEISPLEKIEDGHPGLAFSGGADSSAALAVMPKDVRLVFMNRPLRQDSIYDSSAALEICDRLSESGFFTKIIETDLEYLREPVGFPTDLAHAVPAILISKQLKLDSIAFGTVLESGFGIGHEKYVDYANGAHYRFFSILFSAAGIDICLPTIGISEVGTAIIGKLSVTGNLQQSCIRGKLFQPCYRCWKCFRKELLNYSLGYNLSPPNFEEMLRSKEIQYKLSEYPISHENVITFSMQRSVLNDFPNLRVISSKLDMNNDFSFLEKWYPPSIDFVPPKYRFLIRDKILSFLGPMRYEDEEKILNWSMIKHLESEKSNAGQDKIINLWKNINYG